MKGWQLAVLVAALVLGFGLVPLAGHGPPGEQSAAYVVAPLDTPVLLGSAPVLAPADVALVAFERSTTASVAAVAVLSVIPGNTPVHGARLYEGKESEPRSRDVQLA